MEKFSSKFTVEDLKKNELLNIYFLKATSGKYVTAVKDRLKNMTNEEFIYLLESCKIVNLAVKQTDELIKNVEEWSKGYEGSQPVAKLRERLNRVGGILKAHGAKGAEKHSWGAFLQAFQEKVEPLVASLFFIQPMAQSFNYSRAAYMIMEADTAYAYSVARLTACITIYKNCAPKIGDALRSAQTSPKGASKIISEALYAANQASKFLPGKDEIINAKLNEKKLVELDPNNMAHTVAGAFPVDFRMYLQSITFRRNKAGPGDFQRAKELIMPILNMTDNSAAKLPTRLMLQDKDAAWRKIYFDNFKVLKAVCRSVKRVVNSWPNSPSAQNSGIVRDYSSYSIDISGK